MRLGRRGREVVGRDGQQGRIGLHGDVLLPHASYPMIEDDRKMLAEARLHSCSCAQGTWGAFLPVPGINPGGVVRAEVNHGFEAATMRLTSLL